MSRWLTSDTHFGHKRLVELRPGDIAAPRPMFSCVEEMDEILVNNWNANITSKDTVYHTGDFAWRHHKRYFDRLNGIKYLVKGNHDPQHLVVLFKWVKDVFVLENNLTLLFMSHYPHLSWLGSYHGSFHVHGHCHGRVTHPTTSLALDVGVDAHNFKPVPYDQIIQDLTEKRETISRYNQRSIAAIERTCNENASFS